MAGFSSGRHNGARDHFFLAGSHSALVFSRGSCRELANIYLHGQERFGPDNEVLPDKKAEVGRPISLPCVAQDFSPGKRP